MTKRSCCTSFQFCGLRNVVVPLMMPLHQITLTLVHMVSHNQKSQGAPHFDYLDLRNAMVPLITQSVSHHANLVPVVSHNQTVMFQLISIIITFRMQWYYSHCCLCHLMPMPAPMTSHDQNIMLHLISIILT